MRRDISKIIREVTEITAMVNRCDEDHLIRIVFEEGELWRLNRILVRHFNTDGSPKDVQDLEDARDA